MILLTLVFGKERMHQKSLWAAWIIFVLFVGLGLFYIRHSYMEVVETHIKIYQNILRHCARTLQNKIISNQPEHLLELRQYLQNSEKNKSLITSFYLIKQATTPSQSFLFLNLTTPITEKPETTESDSNYVIGQNIPLQQIFGQDYFPQPITDALKHQTTVFGIVKRADYQENRLIFTTPLLESDGVTQSVLCLEIREEDWIKELLFAKVLPHLFFFSFLFFFFAMQIILIRRRIIMKNLKEHRIISFEQMLDQLISMKTSAEEKSVERNYLIRQVDSEFKKPLIPVLESSFLLHRQIQQEPDSFFELESQPTNLALLEKMSWGCKKLKLILNDIRTLIDFEWNQIDIHIDAFSPHQIIHNLRNICQQHFLEKPNIKFRVDTISTIPDLVRGDQQKIQRVLEELLKVAIDRITNGHIKITCYMSGSQLCWIILDTGEILLTENQIQQLNEFYNREWTHQAESGGKLVFKSNLGSRIAMVFTHLLKGNISFQSTTGHGNKCTVVFPVEI
jgi:signal transduction histidine kinase